MNKLDDLLKMNQADMAKILCCTQARVSQILSTRKPSIKIMTKMAQVTGLPLSFVVGYFYDIK